MKIYQVDAFTEQPFRGNPAAVVLLDREREDAWLQNVAMEMNLSETAFLLPRGGNYWLRWFTPTVEVDLCGHATLASAHVILKDGEDARFETRSGILTARRNGEWIELNFPSTPPAPILPFPGLAAALGAEIVECGKTIFDVLVELRSEEAVRSLEADIRALTTIDARGVIVTARSSEPYDFVSRYFAPAFGIDEDPVTGSAHCALAPYWSAKLGKTEFLAYQASKRGGTLRVTLAGDRVLLAGQAVTVLEGTLQA